MPITGQFPAVVQLSTLNGVNGFVLNGESIRDYSGRSVNGAGDINKDGIDDIIIGADGAPAGTYIGQAYVVFGKRNGWAAASSLASLNGANGFKINNTIPSGIGYSMGSAGDINNDGIQDIIIGADRFNSYIGRTYVIFGRNGPWNSILSIDNLNGTNGFVLDGVINDSSGASVSSAGDINNDGISDILIGAPQFNIVGQGKTYVVFGQNATWNSIISLSSLNGANGFELDGTTADEESGTLVSYAGDINDDGISDIIIGTLGIFCKVHILFGSSTPWSNIISLSSLNGNNGFTLNGTYPNCYASVTDAGDVNADGISDIIIGFPGNTTSPGNAYVIFGKNTSWSSTVLLASLDGTNGFRLDGVNVNDQTGSSVASAGDFNGDGINDIIIGAPQAGLGGGRTYVVFGKMTWTSPFPLSSLDGVNGFRLDGMTNNNYGGVVVNDYSGGFVNTAGDVNGDGVTDIIIGASQYTGGPGKTYVAFGGSAPVLVNNRLNLTSGSTVTLDPNTLLAYNLKQNNNTLVFVVTAVTEGYFQSITTRGVPIFSFTQQQINSNNIQFVHDGSANAPSYNVTVKTNSLAYVGPITANVTFFAPPTNSPSLSPSSISNISSTTFSPTIVPTLLPSSFPSATTSALPTLSPTSSTISPNVTPTLFPTMVANNSILPTFLPTTTPSLKPTLFPSATASKSPTLLPTPQPTPVPSFMSSLPSSNPTTTPTSAATSIAPIPILLQNTLTIGNGQTVSLTPANLQATQPGFNDSQLVFIISNVQQGLFYRMPQNISTYNFPQSLIQNGLIQFRHAGNQKVPGYSVLVSNGVTTCLPNSATIYFAGAPIVQLGALNVSPGAVITLSSQQLNVTTFDGSSPAQVILQIQNLQHASLSSTMSGSAISSFSLPDLQAGYIQLRQDGSNHAPSFTVTAVSLSGISSAVASANITFSSQGVLAPRILNNFLSITQGQSVVLTPLSLQAISGTGQTISGAAIFHITNVQYGYFSLNFNPTVHFSFFTQSQLQQEIVQFTQDGSSNLPNYNIAVEVNGLQSAASPVEVFFTPVSQPPQLIRPLGIHSVTVGQAFSFTVQNSFIDPQGEPIRLSAQYQNSSILPAWLNFDALNGRFIGTAPKAGLTNIAIIATDAEELSSQTDVVIDAIPAPNINASTLEKTLISAGVSGAVGLSFYLFRLCLKRAADKKVIESLLKGQDDFDRQVVLPIAQDISKRVKIIGFTGINERTLDEFKGAVRTLITELDHLGVDIHLDKMDIKQSDALINEIGTQTKQYFLEKRSCGKALCSFFAAEVSPEDIRKAAPKIAERIASAVEYRKDTQVQMTAPIKHVNYEEPAEMDLKMLR